MYMTFSSSNIALNMQCMFGCTTEQSSSFMCVWVACLMPCKWEKFVFAGLDDQMLLGSIPCSKSNYCLDQVQMERWITRHITPCSSPIPDCAASTVHMLWDLDWSSEAGPLKGVEESGSRCWRWNKIPNQAQRPWKKIIARKHHTVWHIIYACEVTQGRLHLCILSLQDICLLIQQK